MVTAAGPQIPEPCWPRRDGIALPGFRSPVCRNLAKRGALVLRAGCNLAGARGHLDLFGGIRALLLKSPHPFALHAVVEHRGFSTDFRGRFQRTSRYVALTTYGKVPDAEHAIAAVRAIHGQVIGTIPDGGLYSADHPASADAVCSRSGPADELPNLRL